MFGRIFGLDGRESYREPRLEPLAGPHRLSRGTAPHEREYPRRDPLGHQCKLRISLACLRQQTDAIL